MKRDMEVLKKETGISPKLVVVQVGEDPASNVYINQKRKAAEASGMLFEHMKFEASISQEELIKKVVQLNEDKAVTGFIVQTPLPKHINEPQVFKHINPYKDVDGCTAYNTGKMFLSLEFEDLAPCTPLGCIRLLEHYKIDVKGKNVTMIGSSNTVGKPLAIMLSNRKATVTICNSKTVDLAAHTRNADIVCVAVGRAKMVTADMVKDGVVIIAIGINRTEEGKLVGDVDFDEVAKKASFITPVPGGVGPMTVACLMENTYKAAKRQTNNLNNK